MEEALHLLLEVELEDDVKRREVAAVIAKHELTLELLEGLSAPAWEALRLDAGLSIGRVESIKRGPASGFKQRPELFRTYRSWCERHATSWRDCCRASGCQALGPGLAF